MTWSPVERSIAGSGVGPRFIPSIVIAHHPGEAPMRSRPVPVRAARALGATGSESTLMTGTLPVGAGGGSAAAATGVGSHAGARQRMRRAAGSANDPDDPCRRGKADDDGAGRCTPLRGWESVVSAT